MVLKTIAALLLLPALVQAQPARLYDCQPFVKGGRGNYFVEPILNIGQHGVHYAWACQNSSTGKTDSFIAFCGYAACSPPAVTKALWRVTTKQSTLVKEWEAGMTIPTPVKKGDPLYPLALEAQQTLDQMVARVKAKEAQ